MRLIMLGAPGAGKGTQAGLLAEKIGVPNISTGDIFRENIKKGTELGRKAKEFIEKGALVPDDITLGIVQDRLLKPDCANGFILDGFPRTVNQAEYLERFMKSMDMEIDRVVEIRVSDDDIVKRLSGRRVCQQCGATYHIRNNPPKNDGVCDECGSLLTQRDDDKEETIKRRLETYHLQTEPLIEYYEKRGKLLVVDGGKPIEETSRELLEALGVE